MYAEATDAVVAITNPPSIELGFTYYASPQMLNFELKNTTRGESFFFSGQMEANQEIEIDCENFTVKEADTRRSRLAAFNIDANTVRDKWMLLDPGSNTLEYRETGVVGVTVEVEYRSRWL